MATTAVLLGGTAHAAIGDSATTISDHTYAFAGQPAWGADGTLDERRTILTHRWRPTSGPQESIEEFFGAKFGFKLSGGSWVDTGVDVRYRATSMNGLDVNYPIRVSVTYPDTESFYPGDVVRISAAGDLPPNAGAITMRPGATYVDIIPQLEGNVSADAAVCVVTCEASVNVGSVAIPKVNGPALTAPSLLTLDKRKHTFTALQTDKTGLRGTLNIPSTPTTGGNRTTGTLQATSTEKFLDPFEVDLDFWCEKTIKGCPPLSVTKTIPLGATATADLLDVYAKVIGTEQRKLNFTPTLMLDIDLPRSLQVVTYAADGTVVEQGARSTVSIPVGGYADVTTEADMTQPFTVGNKVSGTGTVHNRTQHTYDTTLNEDAVQMKVTTPKTDVSYQKEVCSVLDLLGICTAFKTVTEVATFGAKDFTLGPLLSETQPVASFSYDVVNDTWNAPPLTGSAAPALVLDPENIPVADAGGPYTVAEGTSIELDGTGSSDADGDALTMSWTADHAASLQATGMRPRFDGLDGPDAYVVTVTVCDPKGNCDTDTANLAVTNVAPTGVLDRSNLVVLPGLTAAVVTAGQPMAASMTTDDPGTDDAYVSWSAGLDASFAPASSTAVLNNGATADPAVSPFGTRPVRTIQRVDARFALPGITVLTADLADDNAGRDADSYEVLVQGNAERTGPAGLLNAVYGGAGAPWISDPYFASYRIFAERASSVLGEQVAFGTDMEAQMLLRGGGVEANLAAAWVHVARGAVSLNDPAGPRGTGTETILQLLTRAEAEINAGSMSNKDRASLAGELRDVSLPPRR